MAERPGGDPHLFQQCREVNIGGIVARAEGLQDDLDIDIAVRSREEGLAFTVGLWNLKESSWRRIRRKEICVISLGWLETEVMPVCIGRIERMSAEYQNGGADTRYVIEGVDATKEYYSTHVSYTWDGADIGTIASEINGMSGPVAEGVVESPGAIEGMWTIKDDHPTRYWLDTLVDEAEGMTGEQWEWDARAGKFFFHPKGTPGTQATELSPETGLHFAEPATGSSTKDESASDEVSFEAYLNPRIEKNTEVNIQGRQVSGSYLVTEYEYVSDTTTGEHKVVGKAVPVGASYTAPYPGGELARLHADLGGAFVGDWFGFQG